MRALSLNMKLIGLSTLAVSIGAVCVFTTSPTVVSALLASGLLFLILVIVQERLNNASETKKLSAAMLEMCRAHEVVLRKLSALEKQSERGNINLPESGILEALLEKLTAYQAQPVTTTDAPAIEAEVEVVSDDTPTETISGPLGRTQIVEIITQALREDRIEMLMQPIVSLPQRKARSFECFSRIRTRDNTIITPDHFLGIAAEESLLHLIDNILLFRCIQIIRRVLRKNVSVLFFCNLSQSTLEDPVFLEGFIDFFSQNRTLTPHIVFELEYEVVANASPELLKTLKSLNRYGCRYSADQVTSLDIDLTAYAKNNFKFLKIDAATLIKLAHEENGAQKLKAFKAKADKLELDLIVTKVEREEDLVELMEFQYDFGQGYLFGTPQLNSNW